MFQGCSKVFCGFFSGFPRFSKVFYQGSFLSVALVNVIISSLAKRLLEIICMIFLF